jgi:O-antigen/teichoic acid export membrane protein
VACIPVLIDALGTARFGVLTLIWAISSYASLFDLGLGRVLTQRVAAAIELREEHRIGRLVGTAMTMMLVLSTSAGVLLWLAAAPIAAAIQGQPDVGETARAVMAMAIAMPAVIATSGLRGVLEARHAFVAVNAIRLPLGLFTFVGPAALVLLTEPKLDLIAGVLCAGRWVGALAHWAAVTALSSRQTEALAFDRSMVRPLCSSGGWMTVSNVVSPLMGYLDRFLLGAMVSAGAAAYYATPMEIVIRLSIAPAALTAVLFPAFSAAVAARQMRDNRRLFTRSLRWLFCLLWPACVGLALFAHELLGLWISRDFATFSAPLLQVFAIGMLANCLAHVPYTLIQSAGQARTTALIHLAEFPFFVLALWLLIDQYGALGAALAWLLRMLLDTLLMFIAGARFVGMRPAALANRSTLGCALLGLVGFAGTLASAPVVRGIWLALVCGAAVLILFLARTPPRARASEP